jgi:hypothetical protein
MQIKPSLKIFAHLLWNNLNVPGILPTILTLDSDFDLLESIICERNLGLLPKLENIRCEATAIVRINSDGWLSSQIHE